MEYWALINGRKIGPLSLEALEPHGITSDTMVWHHGLPEWIPARDVPELHPIIRPTYAPGGQPAQPSYNNPYGGQAPLCPPNYLAWSIIVTMICCQFTGIIAIIYSAMVENRYRRGDYAGALSASRTAKGWIIGSIAIGLLVIVAYAIYFLVVMGFYLNHD